MTTTASPVAPEIIDYVHGIARRARVAARELAQSGSLEEMRNRLKDADKKA